jgi:anti-sigma B factor antagonist
MGGGDQLKIESQHEAGRGRVVVRLEGELDVASAPHLRSTLESIDTETASLLVLDLQQLRFVDSTGLRVILWARERCRSRGQDFALTPGSTQVQRLLAVSGVGEHLRIVPATDKVVI